MEEFASRTGLTGDAAPRRYLWTDAFAVCNFLALHRRAGERSHLDRALALVDQVHHTLGRHRPDDRRKGWISGLPEEEGEHHPTRGGLRIGKELPERTPDAPFDDRLEWERDGQYFHYLTRWIQALQRVSLETGSTPFHRWARELAAAAHSGFTWRSPTGGPPRMVWKMSIDLSRPLVPSMGHHDPLEALVTYLELAHAVTDSGENAGPELEQEITEADAMCAGGRWATDDPLGIGGLLDATARLGVLVVERGVERTDLLRQLLDESLLSLETVARSPMLHLPAGHRLAFRELGLAIGLHAVAGLRQRLAALPGTASAAGKLQRHPHLAFEIETFWSDAANRRDRTWRDHHDINDVMLASAMLGGI
jgi:hypothetical protein